MWNPLSRKHMAKRTPPQVIVGQNIKRLRTRIGLSQEQLAEAAGIHRTYVSSVERGERNLSVTNIYRLAQALNVDPRELLRPLTEAE